MKLTIDFQHKEYFLRQGMIEFESLLSVESLDLLKNEIYLTLSERSKMAADRLPLQSAEKLFLLGRDLWRLRPSIRKIVLQKQKAQIAYELTGKKPLRIAFDQFFPKSGSKASFSKIQDHYHNLLRKKMTLSEFSSIQGVTCGLMLCLESGGAHVSSVPTIFSSTTGNGIYLSPDYLIDFSQIYEQDACSYLLIVYCDNSAVYIHREEDIYMEMMRDLGYTFGDKLKDPLHPILLR
jgi:hypothetical protein